MCSRFERIVLDPTKSLYLRVCVCDCWERVFTISLLRSIVIILHILLLNTIVISSLWKYHCYFMSGLAVCRLPDAVPNVTHTKLS
jgi:hypothetical protein